MALAGVTGGELRITDTIPHDLRMICLVFDQLGLHTRVRRQRRRSSRAASGSSSSPTSAATSARSWTVRGRRSPPT